MSSKLEFVQDPEKIRYFLQLLRTQEEAKTITFLEQFSLTELRDTIIINNGERMTFMDCAAIQGAAKVMKALHEKGMSINSPTISVFGSINLSVLNYLIDNNAFMANVSDVHGLTPLQNVLTHYKRFVDRRPIYLQVIELMLHCKSDPFLKGFQDLTPVDLANLIGDTPLLKLLTNKQTNSINFH